MSRAFSGGSTAPSYGADRLDAEGRAPPARDLREARPVGLPGGDRHGRQLAGAVLLHAALGRRSICHADSHIVVDEANAPQFFTGGAKLSTIDGPAGKIDPKKLADALAQPVYGVVHHPQPAAVSITQATECGTVYRPDEVASIATSTHRHGLKLHMDGARFANALSFVGCSPAELSWKAGVDVLSLGATKNGALAPKSSCSSIPTSPASSSSAASAAAISFPRCGSCRPSSTPTSTDGLWLANARHANAMARRLVAGLTPLKGTQLLYPVDANEIFVILPPRMHDALQAAGAQYHPWPSDRPGERAYRLVTAFDTDPDDRRHASSYRQESSVSVP